MIAIARMKSGGWDGVPSYADDSLEIQVWNCQPQRGLRRGVGDFGGRGRRAGRRRDPNGLDGQSDANNVNSRVPSSSLPSSPSSSRSESPFERRNNSRNQRMYVEPNFANFNQKRKFTILSTKPKTSNNEFIINKSINQQLNP
jgi:hypothetical protein